MENKHKLRIIVNTNGPHSTSGYGSQAHDLIPRIKDAGYDIATTSFYGVEGGKIMWRCQESCCKGRWPEVLQYPKIGDTWGNDAMVAHGQDFKADVTFTLQDIWVLNHDALKQAVRWIPIVPIDHEPVPPAIKERLRLAYRIVTYAEFGKAELRRQGFYSTYIQHTVDTDIFKPLEGKADIKGKLGVPGDYFLFGMVGANKDNPPRKSFQEVMDAFKRFHSAHPKSAIYFHTILNQQGGFPIREYAQFLGIEQAVYCLPTYQQMFKVNREGMNLVYNAFDVLVMPSTNEGFGVPAIEAQSAGIPVITHDFTAMTELVTPDTGWLCTSQAKRFTPLFSYVAIPSSESIYDRMEEAYRSNLVTMGKAARKHAVSTYSIDKIFNEKWLPFLGRLEEEIHGKNLDPK